MVNILDRGKMSSSLHGITLELLLELRKLIDNSDDEKRAALWKAARIS